MQLIFLAYARDELAEAKRCYNRQQQGLSESFQRESHSAARLIGTSARLADRGRASAAFYFDRVNP